MTATVSFRADPGTLAAVIDRWQRDDLMARLWQKDATVWFDPPRPEVGNRLGWLDLPTASAALIEPIEGLARAARDDGVTDLVLCGMGGSSLAPEVFASTLPSADGAPRLTVIDTTHPDAVAAVTDATMPGRTWYLISSKSGGTLETLSLFRHFWHQASTVLEDPGSHFLAVTDPGSSLEQLAVDRGFRATILADPDVGGRYSALSAFGLVPAGIVGADVARLLLSGTEGATRCGAEVGLADNPGFLMGAIMGTAATRGRDLVRFEAAAPVADLPIWIEQLIAESTGKEGRGIVPIDGGPQPPSGSSVLTVSIGDAPDPSADISIGIGDPYDVASVMVMLEVATAVAGQIIGINPFDQPDVQLAKSLAHQAMEGTLGVEGVDPVTVDDPDLATTLTEALTADPHYVSLQAYVSPTRGASAALETMRRRIVNRFGVMTTAGFGPRFLHSTGQLHKGGPGGGVFIQIVDTPKEIIEIPEAGYSFNELIAAQASGDRAALAERGRTVVAIDIGGEDVAGALEAIENLLSI